MPKSPLKHGYLRLLGVLLALALALGVVPATPANAATLDGLKLVSASKNALALQWSAVPGATSYQVEYATSKTMKKAKRKTSAKPSIEIKKLKSKKTYYIRVTAATPSGKVISKKLKVKTAKNKADYKYLAPAGLSASKVTADSVTLSWKSRSSQKRYLVSIATRSDFSNAERYYVKGTSKTIKYLLDGTRYYARVQVVTSKKKLRSAASPPIQLGTAVYAPTAKGGPATIRVVSYNVGSKTRDAKTHPWSERRSAVAAAVTAQKPDVIGFQEASQGKLGSADLSQAEDLVNRLGLPYKLANTARYNCVDATSPYKCKYKYQGAANSQKIVYNAATLTLLKQGSKKTPSTKTRMEEHRYVEWAIFRHKASGKEFFFVNVHLDPGKTAAIKSIRKKQMDTILAAIKDQNPKKLPTYVVGDFNSHKWTDGGNVPYDRMVGAGYVDPLGNTYLSTKEAPGATVGKRINTQYSSHNNWERVALAKKTMVNGIYIDYIWVTRGIRVPEWETVVKVDKAGKFVGTIPSDHNMLRATTVIP